MKLHIGRLHPYPRILFLNSTCRWVITFRLRRISFRVLTWTSFRAYLSMVEDRIVSADSTSDVQVSCIVYVFSSSDWWLVWINLIWIQSNVEIDTANENVERKLVTVADYVLPASGHVKCTVDAGGGLCLGSIPWLLQCQFFCLGILSHRHNYNFRFVQRYIRGCLWLDNSATLWDGIETP
jgi:hypothetical protein